MFELVDRDANGRTCKLVIGKHKIKTPTIMPVINPNKISITPKEMKKLGAEIMITNSYIIKKSGLSGDVHKIIRWNGPVYTDSGTFQMYSQGIKDLNPEEMIEFQNKIKSDIVTPVDVFTLPTDKKPIAKKKLTETSLRVYTARQLTETLVGPIQGGLYLDLRKQACKEIGKSKPDVFAIGGIVPLMEQYRFKELFDIILTCKSNLPSNVPVHAFGAGHPMVFAPLVALGCDLFDSAMYYLAAKRGGYLTINGTYNLDDLIELPCHCPECSKTSAGEIKKLSKEKRELFLARHNLYVTFSELRTIKQAIKENNLWELVQIRLRAHPNLLEAFDVLKKYKKYLLKQDSVSKKSALFYSGRETEIRPEVIRAKKLLKKTKSKKHFTKKPFGKIPLELKGVYPFGQSIVPGVIQPKQKPNNKDVVKKTIQYQFDSRFNISFTPEVSRKTGRIRRVWKNKKLLGTIRPHDGFFIPTLEGAKYIKMKKVEVRDEAAKHIKEGRSLFTRFVKRSDDIIPGEEVAIISKNKPIATGTALLNKKEIKEFERGVAVKIR